MRIRPPLLEHGSEVTFTFNGRTLTAMEGESLLSALWHHDLRDLGSGRVPDVPRAGYCLVGHCLNCRVRIGDDTGVRSCLVRVQEGLAVRSEIDSP